MAKKDKSKKITPNVENGQQGATEKPEGQSGLELDLSTDPEFLALAADFDAAIRSGKAEEAESAPEPEAVPESAEEPAEAPKEFVGGAAEELSELSSDEQSAPEQPLEHTEPDFVLVTKPQDEWEPAEEQAGEEEQEESAAPAESLEVEPEAAEPSPELDAAKPDASEPEAEPEMAAEPGSEAAEPKKSGGLLRGRSRKRRSGVKEPAAPKLPHLGVETEIAPTMLSRVFNSLSLGAIFVLTAVFLLQLLPGLQTERLLWFSDELRQADVLAGAFNGHWLQIQLNGQLYQEAPPLYFWFLMGLHKLLALAGLNLGADYAKLLYVGAAVSGLLLLWSTYALARSTAHLDRRGAFAAGCVLLSVLFLQFFFHYSSLDLFFAAFIVTSHIFLFKALMRERAPLYMGLAFLCAAVALMSKGALGLTLPVLSAVLFCIWRGKPQRLLKGDFLLGLALALLPAIIWLGSIWATGQHDVVVKILREQVWVKAFGDAWHKGPWWYYLAVLPALWLPWSLIALALPWHRLFSSSVWANIKSARSGERQGLAFVWVFFLGAFALISLIQNKQPVYVLPLMAPLAVLTGRAALQLSPLRSMIFQRLTAFVFFLLAVIFVLLPVYYSGNIPSFFSWLENINLPAWEVKINGIFLLAVIMLGSTCLLIGLVKARRPESAVLVLLLSATLFSYPLSTMSMPSLDSVVSSKAASVELKRYADLGYYPASFRVYSGVFSYYSGMHVNETDDWAELDHMVAAQPKITVIMSAARWQDWTKNPGFTKVMRFWMLSNEYVLLLRNTLQDEAPAPQLPPQFEPEAEPEPEPVETLEPAEDLPAETVPSEEPLPEEISPEEPMLEEPDSDMPPESVDVPAAGEPLDTPAEAEPGAEEPTAEPSAEPAGEAPVEPVGPSDVPDGAPAADEPPVPDGMPMVDEPIASDPFAPFPDEQ